jgi:hypothetical protein
MERRIYTEADAREFDNASAQLRQNGFDDWSAEGIKRNADLMDEYFQQNRVPVTIANIYRAVEARKQDFAWISLAEARYNIIAAENPVAATAFKSWFDSQKTVINTGDEGFQNAVNILEEIGKGRNVDSKTIQDAIARIEAPASKFSTRIRPPLHYVPVSRPVDPRQHQDDGTGFLGKNVNETRWQRLSRERSEREAAEAKSAGAIASAQSAAALETKRQADELRGNTHAESEQIGRVFVTTAGTEIDWPATLQARLALQKSFQKHREVSRFTR